MKRESKYIRELKKDIDRRQTAYEAKTIAYEKVVIALETVKNNEKDWLTKQYIIEFLNIFYSNEDILRRLDK